jgi:hypothetical protein
MLLHERSSGNLDTLGVLWAQAKVQKGSHRAIHRPPIGCIWVYLGKSLSTGNLEEIVEVGEEPGLRLGAALAVRRVAGEMKAAAAAMDGGPAAACAALGAC